MLVGSFPDLLTSGSASATAWQETSPTEGLDGSGSSDLISRPMGPCGSIPTPLEEEATLILLDRGQTAEPPQKVLPESCGHQDDRPRLVPACPIPGDSEGHHGGDRPRSNHLAQLASKPSWPQPSSSSSPSSPGWGCGDPHGCLPSGFALTPTSTPKPIPSPQATSQCPLSTHPGTKWDNGGGCHPGTGAPRPDLPPPCSFWANPCPQRCR